MYHVIRQNESGDILNKKKWTLEENTIGGQYRFGDFNVADIDFKVWWSGKPLIWTC